MRLLQREATRLLCECGHNIFCAVRQEGERLGLLVFFDDEPTSETLGERIRECPGCSERLGLLTLYSPRNRTR
jgi:hypothetical protein